MSGYAIEVEIEGIPPLNSADNRHWRSKKRLKDLWFVKVSTAIPRHKAPEKPLTAARVTITRCSSKACDGDNLHHAAKYILDGLVRAGVLTDDNHTVIGMPRVQWRKTKPKQAKTIIQVEECRGHELDDDAWDYGAKP